MTELPLIGEAVAVYGPWGCGHCLNCSRGAENYCTNAEAEGIRPPGLGNQGSMAEYMIVDDVRHLIPIGDLDPVKNVSLTDAGLTPYHAIKRSLPKLGAGTYAVVIGSGGLGHVGMRERAELHGGQVEIGPRPDGGFRVRARYPVPERDVDVARVEGDRVDGAEPGVVAR